MRSIFLAGGLPVIDELNGKVEIGTFDQSDDVLQGITALVRDAKLVPLFLSLHSLGSIVSNQFAQCLGLLGGNAGGERSVDLVLLAG